MAGSKTKGAAAGKQSAANAKGAPQAAAAAAPSPASLTMFVLMPLALGLVAVFYAQRSYRDRGAGDLEASTPDVEDVSGEPEEPSQAWWQGASWSHRHIVTVNTQNFNATVTNAKVPLLIAYYDPRSASFKALRSHLEQAANELAAREARGEPLGLLGACEATVDSFLTQMEAPEIGSGWQETKRKHFRFGKPRFYPLILIAYVDGQRQGEYVGVVSAEPILQFLTRLRATKGGEELRDARAVRDFLAKPGPLVLGCGFVNGTNESAAFNESSHGMWGTFIFGKLSPALCEAAMGPFTPQASWPTLFWSPGGNSSTAPRSTSNATLLSDTRSLTNWLTSHKVLEEMTPDNSHVYLSHPDPLVIFLVNPKATAEMRLAEALVADMEALKADAATSGKAGDFQFVWSDCGTFAGQFESEGDCPVVVVVDAGSMDWKRLTISALRAGQSGLPLTGSGESGQLLQWLRLTSEPWRPKEEESVNRTASEGMNETVTDQKGRQEEAAAQPGEPRQEEDAAQPGEPVPSADPAWFSSSVSRVVVTEHTIDLKDAGMIFGDYHELLESLAVLRESFKATHGKHVQFDFSAMEKVQALDPNMAMLATSPDKIRQAWRSPKRMGKLWSRIEARAKTDAGLEPKKIDTESKKTRNFVGKLLRGYATLRELFQSLFKTLHGMDKDGRLELPRNRVRQVERRDASELSVTEFLERYASKGQPVIISGLQLSDKPWTLEFFRERCNVTAHLRMKNNTRRTWGRLQDAGRLRLPEFIDSFTTNATRKAWYLHDWSLPVFCPEVFGPAPYDGYVVPKYFAGDYFQRSAFQGYQHTWPSLFIGSEETESSMHIDSGNTHFWLYLLSGRKEWRFYSRADLVNLYKKPQSPHFYPDVFRPVPEHFPLLKYAEMHEGIQEAGDLIFIPAGNPHGVRNLEPIHGVSMNYVDASNIWLYLFEALAQRTWDQFEMFTDNTTIPHGMRSEQQPLRFGEWKSQRWRDLRYDLFF